MRLARALLLLGGLAAAGYGIVLFARTRTDNMVDAAVWLVGGVLVHDGVLAPLTLLLALAVSAVRRHSAPVVVGFVLAAPLTIVAIPVLGRFGARSDNPTLLDRDYLTGWLVAIGVVTLGVLAATLVSRTRADRRRARRSVQNRSHG